MNSLKNKFCIPHLLLNFYFSHMATEITKETNRLFPVFFKLEQLRVLLIGGGNVALEKLHAIVNNSPNTKLRIITKEANDEFRKLAESYPHFELVIAPYQSSVLDDCDLAIVAVNDIALSTQIYNDAKSKGKLVNVADKPSLCDFYLSSVVTKGNLKLAISTNGKSPTLAKRLKEVLNDALPDELDDILNNLQQIRNNLKGDFQNKVQELNKITSVLVKKKSEL